MPIHLYIEKYFQEHPSARKTGIVVKNPPLHKRPKVFKVVDQTVKVGETCVPIRIYTPNDKKRHPVFIFFHGGYFIPGGLESHDVSCRMICSFSEYKVVAVDYTANPNIIGLCYEAAKWIVEHAEQLGGLIDRMAIGGPSIGAYIATSIAFNFILHGNFRFKKQVLFYPVVEFHPQLKPSPHLSRAMFNGKYGIDLTLHPLNVSHLENASVSYYAPFLANNEHLSQMPSTLIFTAEYDPFCDEGEQYAETLKKAGVDVKFVRFDGNVHGFMQNFPGSPDFMRGYEITAEFLLQ